jgi:hypothetical protein
MKKIESLVSQISRKPILFTFIGLLMLFNILMNTPGLPTSSPTMKEYSPTFTPFDLQASGYTQQSFVDDLKQLGEVGRNVYRNFMLLDIFFPAIYGLTFAALLFLVWKNRQDKWRYLFLAPLATAAADYIENLFISLGFAAFPTPSATFVSLASIATQLKMVFNAILILALLSTIVYWLAGILRKK